MAQPNPYQAQNPYPGQGGYPGQQPPGYPAGQPLANAVHRVGPIRLNITVEERGSRALRHADGQGCAYAHIGRANVAAAAVLKRNVLTAMPLAEALAVTLTSAFGAKSLLV